MSFVARTKRVGWGKRKGAFGPARRAGRVEIYSTIKRLIGQTITGGTRNSIRTGLSAHG